jgi:hypothetical protein
MYGTARALPWRDLVIQYKKPRWWQSTCRPRLKMALSQKHYRLSQRARTRIITVCTVGKINTEQAGVAVMV